jgi:hypothetical protein
MKNHLFKKSKFSLSASLAFIKIQMIPPLAPIEAVSFFYLVFFDEIKKDTSE